LTEKTILLQCNHPLILSLLFSFQCTSSYYIVTEFINGGNLYSLLKKEGRFNEERSRYYAAEIIISLEYIHKKEYVTKDLKTNNILISEDGHIRIS
jgi:serine/threonine protein kinase